MDIRKVSEPNVRLRAKWSLIHIVNNESQWHRHASARVISDACAVRDFTFRRKSLKQATAWGSSFSSVFSAMAEPADTETSGNPPGDAAAQQPETLAAQIAQHLLTALQGGSQPPPETGMSPFSTFPIPFHPVGVNNAELARIIGD